MFNKIIEIEHSLYKVGVVSIEQGLVEIVGGDGVFIGKASNSFLYRTTSGDVKDGDYVLYKVHDESVEVGPKKREDGTLCLRKAPGVVKFRNFMDMIDVVEGDKVEVKINQMPPFEIRKSSLPILQSFFKDLGYIISES